MAIVVEISILSGLDGSGAGTISTDYSTASSQGINDVFVLFSGSQAGILTGSYPGNANNWDIYDELPVMSSSNTGVYAGAYPGNANNWDIYELPKDERNQSVITSDNPESDQSISLVDWNYFPLQPQVVIPSTHPMDSTRWRKAYSFTRHQPVRTRLFRS